MGSKGGKSVTVGYRYYWDIQSGLGRGPVDEIVEIRVDNKTAYVAKPGEITQNKAIFIDKENLFGGEDTGGEGGIKGRMEILMGEPDQKPSKMLVNLLKGVYNPSLSSRNSRFARKHLSEKEKKEVDAFFSNQNIANAELANEDMIPGFRGIVSTVFSGLISCYNAYPKPHSYRVRRCKKGWGNGAAWYPEKCVILLRNDNLKISGLTKEQEENVRQIQAMNPAHILVECATNKSWGGKKELSDLDLESYKKAADTLYKEGFGLCIRYNRQGSVKEFVQQIVDHVGGVQYDNVETGKQALKLLRNDYNPDELHTFNYDNGILRVQEDDSSATDTVANQIIVKYRDPVTNKNDQAIANNLASVRMHGVISKTVEYKGLPTFDLAARVAQRDLEMVASSLTRLKIIFDMRASELKPGDVFKLHLPDRNIESAIFRVSQIENGQEGEFVITCMQDVFGLPAANYSTKKSESLYVPPNFNALPISNSKLIEIPYHVYPLIFSEAELNFIKPTDCYIAALASAPTPLSTSFEMLVDAGAGFRYVTQGSFIPSVLLSEDVGAYETQLKFKTDGDSGGLTSAIGLMLDDEILKIESVDFKNATITVGRGCADTIPQAHKANARAWCYLYATDGDPTKYTVNETLKAKLLTKTSQETLSEESAKELSITTQQRQARPYPPGNVKVDNILGGPITDSSKFTITWSHRDRVVQADKLIAHTADSTMLEAGASYEIVLLDSDTVVRKIKTTESEFVYPDAQKVDDETFNKVVLYSIKNDLKSLYQYEFKVAGAMTTLYDYDYQDTFTSGDNYLNRYHDGYFENKPYFMLASMNQEIDVYRDYAIEKAKYSNLLIDFKILTYSQRQGKCQVVIELFAQNELIKSISSEKMGDYENEDWHTKQIMTDLSQDVDKIRFRIKVDKQITTNAIAFTDINIRAGE